VGDERIEVEVVRSGGVTGMTRTARADTHVLDDAGTATLRALVTGSSVCGTAARPGTAGTGAPDHFQYDVTLVRGEDRRTAVLREGDLSDADRRLVRWVLQHGRPTR
jgi:hypothetical protein